MSQRETLYKDWTFARDSLRRIIREWNHVLTLLESRAVLFVYDRTIGWGKEWEIITGGQASEGIWSDDGKPYCAPITKKRDRAVACLYQLCLDGFLKREKVGQFYKYALELDPMKIPKRLRDGLKCPQPTPFPGHEPDPNPGHQPTPFSGHKEKGKGRGSEREQENAPPARSGASEPSSHSHDIDESVAKVQEITVAVTKRKRPSSRPAGKFARRANEDGTGDGFVPFRSKIAGVWKDMLAEHFPEVRFAPLAFLSVNILHQYATNWTLARKEGEFMDYLEWVFINWSALGAGVFNWMKDFPPAPSVRILTNSKLRTYIEEAYQTKEQWESWRKLNEVDRRIQFLVNRRGMDRVEAEKQARKELGYKDEAKRLAQERKNIEILAARAQQAIDNERAALSRQKRKQATSKAMKPTEGSFGKFE